MLPTVLPRWDPDSDKLPQSPDYAPADFAKIQTHRLKAACVPPGKYHLRTTMAKVFPKLAGGLATSAVTAVTGYCAQLLLNDIMPGSSNVSAMATATGIVTAMTTTLNEIILSVVASRLSPHEAMKLTYENYRRLSEDAVKRRPGDIQEACTSLDEQVQELLKRKDSDQSVKVSKFLDARSFLLKLPTEEHITVGSTKSFSADQQKTFKAKVDELTKLLPESSRDALRLYLYDLAAGLSIPAIFLGPGGVGKTFFADLVAKVLGVPLIPVMPDPKRGGGYAITPTSLPYTPPFEDAPPISGQYIGQMVEELAKAGVKNPVLLLDEAEFNPVVMRDLKLAIQDDKLVSVVLQPYEVRVDLSKVRIIIASNGKPDDSAFIGRFRVFQFPPVSDALKREHAVQKMDQQGQKYLDKYVVDESTINTARQMIHEIVDEVVAADSSPGVRESASMLLELFSSVINDLRDDLLTGEVGADGEVLDQPSLLRLRGRLDDKCKKLQAEAKETAEMVAAAAAKTGLEQIRY